MSYRQIVVDTETTGLNPLEGHRIIEIGAVELLNRRITGDYFHVYLNPNRAIDRDAFTIHGLSDNFLADKPSFVEVWDDFLKYIVGAEVIMHNASFDVDFFNHELELCGKRIEKITDYVTVIDSLTLARKKHPGQRNSLNALCKRYRIDNSKRDLHGAFVDAELLAKVYLAMTGGQLSLLSQLEKGSKNGEAKREHLSIGNLRKKAGRFENFSSLIVYADSEEIAEHCAYLEMIGEKSGNKCLWDEDV